MMFFSGSQLSQEELISAPRVTDAAVYDKTAVHRLVRMVYGDAGVALIAQQSFLDQNILIKNAMSTLNEYFFLNLSIPEDITPFLNKYVPDPIIHLALFGNGETTTHVEWVLRELIYDQVLRIPQDLPLTTLFGSGFFPKDSTLSVTAQLVHGNVTKQIAVNHATNTLTEELYLANKVESQTIPWVEENWKQILDEYIHDRTGIEVGGPSPDLFGDIYSASKTFDLVNFAAKTLWGNIEDGGTHSLHGGHGKTFIRDGSTLVGIMDGSYDFALGAHYLEHLLNPIQAIFTMHRVLKVGGVCVLVLPKKEECFDNMRSLGSIEDMVFRFLHRIPEDDMRYAHVEQVTLQSRLEKDIGIPQQNRNYGWFRSRCMMNVENRAIHQFVFDDNMLRKILELMGFTVVFSGNKKGLHQVIVGRKLLQVAQ
ncbi:hypothetical protein ACHAWU_001931 [Discostella pseudostelligera]|uniref:Methyltransferase type 11 domain-containing protein n=1 Tax=Discostella pseudostelligera TaxID=259834 RepID=A0ABD3MKI0_9STRA